MHHALCNAHRTATCRFLLFCLHYPYSSFICITLISLVLFPSALKPQSAPNLGDHLFHPRPIAPKPWILYTSSPASSSLKSNPLGTSTPPSSILSPETKPRKLCFGALLLIQIGGG
ncbi:hypothetical protein ACB092_11G109800 [Castanea dentata]